MINPVTERLWETEDWVSATNLLLACREFALAMPDPGTAVKIPRPVLNALRDATVEFSGRPMAKEMLRQYQSIDDLRSQ